MSSLIFPTGIDFFTPTLFNNLTVVNKDHVQDLRNSILLIENALIGSTIFPYNGTNIITSGDNIQTALQLLDQNLYTLQQQLGFFYDGYDGYASRIDSIQSQFEAHRIAQGPTDADGYGVHGVSGQIVGTLNPQYIYNKSIDSGSGQVVGPKLIARSTIADYVDGYLGQQIQVYGSTGNLNAWINDLGDAYFAGDLVVEGNRVLRGYDVIEQSLVVDGYSILGNNPSVDYLTAYGPFTLIGTSGTTLTVGSTGNIVGNGANVSLGNSTGTLNLNFVQANISASTNTNISTSSLTVSGPVTLGSGITINGSLSMPLNSSNITTAGQLSVLGGLFTVLSGITTIGTSSLNITSSTITMNGTSFDGYGNINSLGTAYTFGNSASSATYLFGNSLNGPTSSFVVYANTVLQEQLTVVGTLQSGAVTTTGLTVNGSTNLNTGTQQDGYVWTAVGSLGAGTWEPSLQWWNTVVVTTTYNANHRDEVFANTSGGSVLINLPSPAVLGNKVRIIDFSGTWGTFSTTVAATATIMGSPTLILSASNGWVELVYNGIQWQTDDLVIGDLISNATAGSVLFVGPAGALQQDNANFFWDNTNNRLGIGTTSPTQTLSIGSTNQFQIDTTGNIVKLNNVTTNFPSSQGAALTYLRNDGFGNLSWVSQAGTGTVTLITSAYGPLSIINNTTTPIITLPQSSISADGYLAATDFTTFNNKVSTTRTISTTGPLLGGGDLSADRTLSMTQATTSVDGYLAATDFTTFNNKEPAQIKGTISSSYGPLSVSGGASSTVGPAVTLTLPKATTSADGYLTATDFTTFNDKANSSLNNLTTTAINADLLPSANNARSFGSSTLGWRDGYFNEIDLLGSSSGIFAQQAAASTTSYSVTWPAAQASGTKVLQNDGSGNLSWAISSGVNIQTISSNISLVNGITYLVDTTAARTLTLPSPVNNAIIYIKDKSGSAATNNITLNPTGGLIEGVASQTLAKNFGTWAAISDGTNWYFIITSTTMYGP